MNSYGAVNEGFFISLQNDNADVCLIDEVHYRPAEPFNKTVRSFAVNQALSIALGNFRYFDFGNVAHFIAVAQVAFLQRQTKAVRGSFMVTFTVVSTTEEFG